MNKPDPAAAARTHQELTERLFSHFQSTLTGDERDLVVSYLVHRALIRLDLATDHQDPPIHAHRRSHRQRPAQQDHQ